MNSSDNNGKEMNNPNKKSNIVPLILGALFFVLLGMVLGSSVLSMPFTGHKKTAANNTISICIGDNDIKDYRICSNVIHTKEAKRLQSYIEASTGYKLPITSLGKDNLSIVLNSGEEENYISAVDGNIYINAVKNSDLSKEVDVFANTYLGYAFAGESNEHILSVDDTIKIKTDFTEYNGDAWIEEREPIICLWNTTTARGSYYDENTSLKSELMSYSDDQLYQYVKMMKYCGFTGIQVTDMCSTWAAYGGYEFVQQRIRFMADAAHSLGMNFTLWVWAAEFNGYGWDDNTVEYYDYTQYVYAYENPDAIETFDKYYTIYAELADCCDRVILHHDDPGALTSTEDVAFFSKMLQDKFLAINPDVDFGISCYTDKLDLTVLNETFGPDLTVYFGASITEDNDWERLRGIAGALGYGLGIWSWNLCEMEIDQVAEMNVNSTLIKNVYLRTRENDIVYKPTYWSEMDSYHIVNIYSLYCSGQLLKNPDEDEKEILKQIAVDTVGPEYGEDFYEILNIIEDARTGEDWGTFRWEQEDYILMSDAYDAQDILSRCDKYMPVLDEMIEKDLDENTLPLPFSTSEVLSLVRPHLEQIRLFAQFRIDLAKAYDMYEEGRTVEDMQKYINNIYKPIPEFNCVIGLWGQPEQRAQYLLTERFCAMAGIETPKDPVFIYYRKQRLYGDFCALQRKTNERRNFNKDNGFQVGLAFGDQTRYIVDELIKDGLLTETPEGDVYVTDWEKYKYNNLKAN